MSGIVFNAGIWAVGPYVISFNTRTGAITLLSADVISALGFTPEDISNKATDFTTVNNVLYPTIQAVVNYIASLPPGGVVSFNTRTGAITLLSADVISALGYTPYSNAGGTITGNAIANANLTVNGALNLNSNINVGPTSIFFLDDNSNINYLAANGAGTIEGLWGNQSGDKYLRKYNAAAILAWLGGGSVSSFNTRTGAVVLLLADVIGALGYTPVNKAGDTMSGDLTLPNFKISSATPSIVAGPGAGTSPSITIDGNNSSGRITIVVGTSPVIGVLCTVTFSGGFSYTSESFPVITVGGYNVGLAIPPGLIVAGGNNSWDVYSTIALTPGVGLEFSINYYCGGR